MDATWHGSNSKTGYLLHSVWIAFLILFGIVIGQNFIGWLFTTFIGFLIFPKFWERRDNQGKRGFSNGRTVIAVMFTVVMAYTAWSRAGKDLTGPEPEAVAAVSASLRDPSSAEFRNITSGTNATCGEVNGKNGFGGYAGFKAFVYENGTVLIEPEEPVLPDVEKQTKYLQDVAAFTRARRSCL